MLWPDQPLGLIKILLEMENTQFQAIKTNNLIKQIKYICVESPVNGALFLV